MNHASLFSGIGGFDEAAEWMGWDNLFHCDNNRFVQHILKYFWPNAISYGDIKQTDFTIWRGLIDVLTGGFPCQPYSTAGKRLGKQDDRHLWPEMLRAIREIQPRWVVGENVLGIVNWNGGLVFEEVQADLEAEGYQVQPYVLPAAGVEAPHERYRVFFVAYRNDRSRQEYKLSTRGNVFKGRHSESGDATDTNIDRSQRREEETSRQDAVVGNNRGSFTNASGPGLQERIQSKFGSDGKEKGASARRKPSRAYPKGCWEEFPTVSPICSRDDGVSDRLDSAALLNGRTPRQPWRAFAKWRHESIKAAGNAVVPQVVYQIFKAIEQYEKQTYPKEV